MDMFEQISASFVNSYEKTLEARATRIVNETFKILFEDILFCINEAIKDFYNDYTPLIYDRHGNLDGFNLYKSIEQSSKVGLEITGDLVMHINFTPNTDAMLPYASKTLSDEDILNNIVFEGVHGDLDFVPLKTISTIQTDYFNLSGTINEILKQIEEQFNEASKKVYKNLLAKGF